MSAAAPAMVPTRTSFGRTPAARVLVVDPSAPSRFLLRNALTTLAVSARFARDAATADLSGTELLVVASDAPGARELVELQAQRGGASLVLVRAGGRSLGADEELWFPLPLRQVTQRLERLLLPPRARRSSTS